MSQSVETSIYTRMATLKTFTFAELHLGLPDEAYRTADRLLQKFRKRGWATFTRDGRNCVWSLTDAGREYLRSFA